ncbi:MAG: hypothetical protein PHQ50_01645 [Eubacteriales bacterium]|nr:hypothetical protein [Eubacteriales bacterium]
MFGHKFEHKKDKMVLIAGCGRLGGSLASVIFGIDKVYARFYDTDKQNVLKGLNIQAILPSNLSIHEFEKLNATDPLACGIEK